MADPVGSIRAFSYLDNGNLDSLEDGPGRGKQQQHKVIFFSHYAPSPSQISKKTPPRL